MGSPSHRKEKDKKRKISEESIKAYMAIKAEKAMKAAKIEKFVWRKKIERDVARGVPIDEVFSVKAEKERQRERMEEIGKLKKRKEERVIEKSRREEEMALLARERARAEFQDWEKKEEEFQFDQSELRSKIRCREGRMKPIDMLIAMKNLDSSDYKFGFGMITEAYKVFDGLTLRELEELLEDIKMHLGLDRATPRHIKYWDALVVVCDWELAEARRKDELDQARARGELVLGEGRVLQSGIEADVQGVLQGKSYGELEALESEIESQMRSGAAKVVEFWEAVLKHVRVFRAKACLREIHAQALRKRLEHLERLDMDKECGPEPEREEGVHDHPEPVLDYETREAEGVLDGSYSPQLLHDHDDYGEAVIDPEEDGFILEKKRIAVLQERRKQEIVSWHTTDDDCNLEERALKAMGSMEEGDALFGSNEEVNVGEIRVDSEQVYRWHHDKYRPKKPKYINRVHTGYEWNKYNQTHYDHDNPPPKTVQGYKFNIFYPNLVDNSKAPSYSIEKDGDSSETCIIRFHAGPPYEDIAFRIVNKDWEYSRKKGFKCTFERGILHLYFNVIRYRYRR